MIMKVPRNERTNRHRAAAEGRACGATASSGALKWLQGWDLARPAEQRARCVSFALGAHHSLIPVCGEAA